MIDGTDMTATACKKWKGLFSLGEEFDDEDLLEPDWTCPSERTSSTAPSVAPPSESSHVLAEISTHVQQRAVSLSSGPGENTSGSGGGATLRTPTCGTINSPPDFSIPCHQTLFSLRAPASSLKPSSNQINHPLPASLGVPQRDLTPQDDFDDWDVDLEELDSIPQVVSEPQNISSPLDNLSPVKRMRHSAPEVSSHGRFGAICSESVARPLINSSFASNVEGPRCSSTPMQNPNHRRIPATLVSRVPRPVTTVVSPQCHRGTSSPRTPLQPRGSLFHSVSSAIDSSSTFTPRPLNTPVLTNHLVQLVSAANKTPQRPQNCMMTTKARRFPGPAGALPQQVSGGSLDDIVVSVPQTPAHGAVARLRNEVSSSQVSEEEEFSRGPWAVMKSEMGLDEKNPSCFLHLYSIVMVLRKAALRQLTKNKVPNMAVVLKSITHTHVDAKAIFRDPTGEMQGTVHRRLVEDRQGELKTGAVLLLKQVGVFSPSHRNHYLNVTPNNLLRIYPPDGVFHNSQPSHPPLQEFALGSEPSRPAGGPVSQMVLHFDDEDENTVEESRAADGLDTAAGSNELCQASTVLGPTEDTAWDTDDLDELLGELPVESYDGLC
ncbi:homologous recombination OB-fold protein isoform X2 [Siphateles boraxobius]|uniref:homologous recombination OB-fold protein isoform X2 n=1 Tax=Siphateles boraxobius TaxID=180520 RepID=UPI004063627F